MPMAASQTFFVGHHLSSRALLDRHAQRAADDNVHMVQGNLLGHQRKQLQLNGRHRLNIDLRPNHIQRTDQRRNWRSQRYTQ
jgi:hypothetical protein